MKKWMATLLAMMMVLSVTGCGNKSKFSSASKRLIKAAENVCGASEASSKKEVKAFTADEIDVYNVIFSDGLYYTFEADELEKLASDEIDGEKLKSAMMFFKSEGRSAIGCYVIEYTEKDDAEKFFKKVRKSYKNADDEMEEKSEYYDDYSYGFLYEDSEVAVAEVIGEENRSYFEYFKLEGNVVSYVAYMGLSDTDIVDEYYELMNEGNYCDLEELMDS